MERIKILALNKIIVSDLAIFSLFLAVAILAPLAGNQLVTGIIVNAVLFVSCVVLGVRGAILLALIPSVFALASGILPPALVPMIPFIMLGNVILILIFDFLKNKNFWLGMVSGAILKFIFLYNIFFVVVNLIIKKEIAQSAAAMMSWPQLLTALFGGGVAYLTLRFFKKIDAR
jgi:hypothetical protein